MKEIHLAFIATGFMGTLYSRICHQMPGVRVSALLDIDPERVVPLSAEIGAPAYIGADYRKMLAEHPEIDAVIITTPEDAHVAPALAVISEGKHFLLEKPMATSVKDARVILEACHGKGLISMMGYSLRFDPRYVAAKKAVERGDIGEVIHFVARRNMPLAVLQRLKGRVEGPFWVGVHDIDMMRWMVRSDVKRVQAMVTKKGLEDWPIQGTYFALLEFENGAIAFLENSWTPTHLTGRAEPFYFKVEGTRGQVDVRSYDLSVSVFREQDMLEPDTVYMPTSFGRITGVYHDQMAYFIQCLREGTQTDISLEEGWNGVMAAEAIVRSAAERREIVL